MTDKGIVTLLRLGLGFSFLYPGIAMLIEPNVWLGWFPAFIIENLPSSIPAFYVIYVTGVFDILIGFLLVFGIFLRWAAIFGVVHLVGVLALGPAGSFVITFRDVGLVFSLAALYLLVKKS